MRSEDAQSSKLGDSWWDGLQPVVLQCEDPQRFETSKILQAGRLIAVTNVSSHVVMVTLASLIIYYKMPAFH